LQNCIQRQASYRVLFDQGIDDLTLEQIRDATNKAWVRIDLNNKLSSKLVGEHHLWAKVGIENQRRIKINRSDPIDCYRL
jgi:hypothetical protein